MRIILLAASACVVFAATASSGLAAERRAAAKETVHHRASPVQHARGTHSAARVLSRLRTSVTPTETIALSNRAALAQSLQDGSAVAQLAEKSVAEAEVASPPGVYALNLEAMPADSFQNLQLAFGNTDKFQKQSQTRIGDNGRAPFTQNVATESVPVPVAGMDGEIVRFTVNNIMAQAGKTVLGGANEMMGYLKAMLGG
ncbi:hypothetical protein [Magnetospirillum moscoviense]|uniref:Uncharacterized protein n=1 Tax=Magnetospirillum moscoviense TaxID=1437059 RepID=A0A178MR18_9PROT|nr:hypothetical protein [Magnetospirillum moscoviense]MBF0326331.1 hypothetical protein [Alphaproteobacteria bacterium]OAN50548.1 hypothetical protein A6A05_12305 [Magnetospirillum moscoviense]